MNFEEIAEAAYYRKGISKLWELPQRYAYLQLEELYYSYKIGNVGKEDSIIKKKKIQKEYEYNQQIYENYLNVYKEYNENRVKYSMLLCNIGKAKSKKDMITNALEIISMIISDDTFVERNLNNFSQLE